MTMAETVYGASAMEQALERNRARGWGRQAAAVLRRNIISIAALAVIVSILMQSMAIYAMQRNISDINNEIRNLQRSNETLRSTVLQANNLDKTRAEAMGQDYVSRVGLGGVKVDLEYNNFTGSGLATGEGTTAEGTLIDRLLAVFE